MKLLAFCLILSLFQVSGSVYSQKTKFNLVHENISLVNILQEIENKSDYKFLYRTDLIDMKRKVSLNTEEAELEELLGIIFPSKDASFRFFEDNIVAITANPFNEQ